MSVCSFHGIDPSLAIVSECLSMCADFFDMSFSMRRETNYEQEKKNGPNYFSNCCEFRSESSLAVNTTLAASSFPGLVFSSADIAIFTPVPAGLQFVLRLRMSSPILFVLSTWYLVPARRHHCRFSMNDVQFLCLSNCSVWFDSRLEHLSTFFI